MIGDFDKTSTSVSSITYPQIFLQIFISIDLLRLGPRSPSDSSGRLMTKTYGYEGVSIDFENDRGFQGMVLK